jgi:Ulp1 family protease
MIVDYFQKELDIDCSSWVDGRSRAPQQFGENDCGVYMCQFAKISLFKSYSDIPTDVSAFDMLDWRATMVLELASGKIRWESGSSNITTCVS